MDLITLTYTIYLTISIGLTIWVARTLSKSGRIFLVDCFGGNKELAESVNHLLVVGFYLINAGFVALYLKLTTDVIAPRGVFEAVSMKVGVVLLVLGAMHFFNLFLFTKMRKRTLKATEPARPPVPPTAMAKTTAGH